jgi:hypothetical protein
MHNNLEKRFIELEVARSNYHNERKPMTLKASDWNKRYASGSSLDKTAKEKLIDWIDEHFAEPLDEFDIKDMKKLNCETLRQLLTRIKALAKQETVT